MSQNRSHKIKKQILLVDESLCIGCFGCDVACKLEHQLPAGLHPFRVATLGPFQQNGQYMTKFSATTCFHCERPACVAACPTGAMQKRDDGIVFSDLELCIGCQTCAVACPFGIPQLNPATGKIAKCDGCKDRVDLGLWPVCALKCPTGALSFGSPIRIVQNQRAKEAQNIVRTFSIG